MQILSLKRNKTTDSGLKVYGEVLGDSGKTYKVAYFRRPNFRGWICSCENFILSKFGNHRNCKHLRFVREQVGRYGATVEPTRAIKRLLTGGDTDSTLAV